MKVIYTILSRTKSFKSDQKLEGLGSVVSSTFDLEILDTIITLEGLA